MNFEKPNIEKPDDEEKNKAENESEQFHGQETVNGHELVCGYYTRQYEMHFPQIEFPVPEEAKNKGVYDQNIVISDDREDAEFVFNKAKQWAEEEDDIYELYKKVENLIHTL